MTNSTKTAITAVVIIVIIGAIIWGMRSSSKTIPSSSTTETTTTTTTNTTIATTTTTIATTTVETKEKTYTLADIAPHSTATDCWTTINGNVYNLTSSIPNHPGGNKILVVCGKDGTMAFTNQHDTQKNPNAALATFKIGILAK